LSFLFSLLNGFLFNFSSLLFNLLHILISLFLSHDIFFFFHFFFLNHHIFLLLLFHYIFFFFYIFNHINGGIYTNFLNLLSNFLSILYCGFSLYLFFKRLMIDIGIY